MQLENTEHPDVKLIVPKVFGDSRGFFMETFRLDWFQENCANVDFVQHNYSRSNRGALRGLHYQLDNVQGKLVQVVQGTVFDVAVDVRRSSPYFGKWVGYELSAENRRQMWVPPGFAHGFYVLSESADFCYQCTDYYNPNSEVTILYNDPDLAIAWPELDSIVPTLSEKDKRGLKFSDAPVFP